MKDKYKEWLIDYCDKHVTHPDRCEAFEAGAQSRQAEIDELQKRIDRLLLISGCDLDENDFES